MYDQLLIQNPLFDNTNSLRIEVDVDNLALDVAELIVKNKYPGIDIYEYDDANDIYLFKEDYYNEILKLQAEFKEYLLNQHAI